MKEIPAKTDLNENQKGEKRKRTDESSEQPHKKIFKITEDEPEIDSSKVLLSWCKFHE